MSGPAIVAHLWIASGAPEGTGLVRRIACNTVFADAGRPSHVILPIMPGRA